MSRQLLVAAALTLTGAMTASAQDGFVVIVNPSVQGAGIKRADLAALFLKKAARWGGGVSATPVDQSGTSTVRKVFSESVIRQPVTEVVQYWQKQMFASTPLRPPAVKASDAEVIAFVANTAGAVGYVSDRTPLPPEVRPLALVD